MKFEIGDCILAKDNKPSPIGTGIFFKRARIQDIYLKDERIKYKVEILTITVQRMYVDNYENIEINQKELEYLILIKTNV